MLTARYERIARRYASRADSLADRLARDNGGTRYDIRFNVVPPVRRLRELSSLALYRAQCRKRMGLN